MLVPPEARRAMTTSSEPTAKVHLLNPQHKPCNWQEPTHSAWYLDTGG